MIYKEKGKKLKNKLMIKSRVLKDLKTFRYSCKL
jgi:hypothetical protein